MSTDENYFDQSGVWHGEGFPDVSAKQYHRFKVQGKIPDRHEEAPPPPEPEYIPPEFRFSKEDINYYRGLPAELRGLRGHNVEVIKPRTVPWNDYTKQKYAYHYYWEFERDKGWDSVVPFSKNIGPGNKLQAPLTGADSIAAGHDIHYSDAKSDADIKAADDEAISHFAYEAVNGGNPLSQAQAAVGFLGLGAKKLAEKAAGKVLYGKHATCETIRS